MSLKGALVVAAVVVSAVSTAGILTTQSPATGQPASPPVPDHAADAVCDLANAPVAAPAPATALHLSKTLHLIDGTVGTISPDARVIITAALTRTSGKSIGSGVYTCMPVAGGGDNCTSAFAFAGGLLLGSEAVSNVGAVSGTVTGGTGAYAHATGTIEGSRRSDGKFILAISYSTG